MKSKISAVIVILLISSISLTYFSCEKNVAIDNSETIANIISNPAEEAGEIIDEINSPDSGGDEIKMISNITDWEELGFDKNDGRYIFLDAFLNGDTEKLEAICGLETGTYDSYKTIKISEYNIQRQPNESNSGDFVLINMIITDSEVECRLSSGKYSYIIENSLTPCFRTVETNMKTLLPPQEALRKWFLLGYYELYRDFSDTEELRQYSQSVFDFMQMEINKDYPSPDRNGWTLDAIKKAAKEYFYLDDFDAEYIPEENGIYSIGAHGGMVRAYDFIGEPETDGQNIKVTVRFYADLSKTVRSHTVVYTLKLKDGIYRFADSERVYDSPFKPFGFSM